MFLVTEFLHVEVEQNGALHFRRLLLAGSDAEIETIEADSVLLTGQSHGGLLFEQNEGEPFLESQSLDLSGILSIGFYFRQSNSVDSP